MWIHNCNIVRLKSERTPSSQDQNLAFGHFIRLFRLIYSSHILINLRIYVRVLSFDEDTDKYFVWSAATTTIRRPTAHDEKCTIDIAHWFLGSPAAIRHNPGQSIHRLNDYIHDSSTSCQIRDNCCSCGLRPLSNFSMCARCSISHCYSGWLLSTKFKCSQSQRMQFLQLTEYVPRRPSTKEFVADESWHSGVTDLPSLYYWRSYPSFKYHVV